MSKVFLKEPLLVNVHLGTQMHTCSAASLGTRTTITPPITPPLTPPLTPAICPAIRPLNLRISPSITAQGAVAHPIKVGADSDTICCMIGFVQM